MLKTDSDGATTHYFLDAHGKTIAIQENTAFNFYNVMTPTGELTGQEKVNGSSRSSYYYLKDHLGSIRVTVKASDESPHSWDDYYPFGMVMEGRSGNSGLPDARYKFLAKERDVETGIDWLDARGYDARIGRFLGVDPVAQANGMSRARNSAQKRLAAGE